MYQRCKASYYNYIKIFNFSDVFTSIIYWRNGASHNLVIELSQVFYNLNTCSVHYKPLHTVALYVVPTAGFPTSCFSTDAGGVALTQIAISFTTLASFSSATCSLQHSHLCSNGPPNNKLEFHLCRPSCNYTFVLLSGTFCVKQPQCNEQIQPLQVCEIPD